jgi:hypothetical protein
MTGKLWNAKESDQDGCNLLCECFAGYMPLSSTKEILKLIDFARDKACNWHVAQRPLTKGVLFAPATRRLLAT